MVPIEEFDALKNLLAQIEYQHHIKCQQKDLYIEGFRAEIERLKSEFAIYFEEFKLHHEIKAQDLEQKVKQQQQRLDMFEKNAEFDEIL